ncbi:Procollagen-lysine,2-oxoglutarate 5-dioxygenase [Nesidiocoris tenuis]|uniref:procollagen-lysine 5-dioxygenase n=1 Tax=Nesidiocoris tenuis TaxID=355587 RepID=A0ABN7B9H7_9HEMI|nr:Procollagen-lysine,2-oxoglutarate 5-dioxygenase [Nesidiocoris tenuis]
MEFASYESKTLIPASAVDPKPEDDLITFTVATDETDGYLRYIRSAHLYGYHVKTLGMNEKWKGGDMYHRGGGHKVNLLRSALKPLKGNRDIVILFTDSYDVVFLGLPDQVLEKFKAFDSRIVFSAEITLWPDRSLFSEFPATENPYKYLNSGAFIGYAGDLYEILDSRPIKNDDDDQLYYTQIFLNKTLREKYRMRLDTKGSIFQNMYGATQDLKLNMDNAKEEGTTLENVLTGEQPLVLHGNGLSKLAINSFANYLARSWDPINGCTACPKEPLDVTPPPIVMLSIFIPWNTPFLEEFFERIQNLTYPKNRMILFVYNNMPYHDELVANWIDESASQYLSHKKILSKDTTPEAHARDLAVQLCIVKKCDYFFAVDSVAHLDNRDVLQNLLQARRKIVAPMLVRPNKAWSNFWGDISPQGYYARSMDYMEIVNNERRGLWNVPYIASCYLIMGDVLPKIKGGFNVNNLDPDMALAQTIRDQGIFMYVDNREDYGHLVDADTFDITLTHPELYQNVENQYDWARRYIHENYSANLLDDNVPLQPCPDVYWFPVVTPRYAKELIEVMETYGKWSSGKNTDDRLSGGYENVPTRDIHMNQVAMERQWLAFLGDYVRPLQEKVFIGYFHDPPKSLMNFVVRYKPDEQPSLRPHHDSSTYTINLALNKPGVDYTGGGCRFIRYNCSVTNTRVGWLLMHPGRLTHYHEGLKVTSGTRYIVISFVDP